MYCPECYNEMPEDIPLCQNCGCPLITAVQKERKILKERYEIISSLAEGGMGEVLLAYDLRLKRPCAVKGHYKKDLCKIPYNERELIVKPFEKEAEVMANLRHPNLPCVTDYFIETDTCYIVMDYIEGKDLEVMLDEGEENGLPEKQVIEWSIQLCRVLEYIHNHIPPIIHGDIKPANLIIRDRDKWLMLVDFGSASFKKLTSEGQGPYGTDGYASPEQYMGIYDTRSDIYSLGCTMYELLTATLPEEPFKFEPLRNFSPSVSYELENIVMKCLEYKVERRISSVTSLKQRLLAAYNKKVRRVKNRYATGMIQNEEKINMARQALEARKKKVKVFISDGEVDKISLYKDILEHLREVRIMGVTYNGREVIENITEGSEEPDLILLGVNMPFINDVQIIKELKEVSPSIKIIAMSNEFIEDQAWNCINNGASGYIVKSEASWEEVGKSIKEALKGETVILSKASYSVLKEVTPEKISLEAIKTETSKECPHCSKPNRSEAKFCNECGKKLRDDVLTGNEEEYEEEIIEEIIYVEEDEEIEKEEYVEEEAEEEYIEEEAEEEYVEENQGIMLVFDEGDNNDFKSAGSSITRKIGYNKDLNPKPYDNDREEKFHRRSGPSLMEESSFTHSEIPQAKGGLQFFRNKDFIPEKKEEEKTEQKRFTIRKGQKKDFGGRGSSKKMPQRRFKRFED